MTSFTALLLVMAGAAIFCRFAGFVAMRYLPDSPRLDAALRTRLPATIIANATKVKIEPIGNSLLFQKTPPVLILSNFGQRLP